MVNRITLSHIEIPMAEPFRISSGVVDSKESVIIRIERDGLVAFGEASPMSGGFYSTETPESSFEFLAEKAIPDLIAEGVFRPSFVEEGLRGSSREPFAWAGLEGALWDLRVLEENTSFPELLEADPHPIESGLAVGIPSCIEDLIETYERYLRDGYKRLKIKIEPGWDLKPLRAVSEAFAGVPLMVDANSAYSEEHFPVFERMDELGLLMIEQPLSKNDIEGHSRLQRLLKTPICFDESASSVESLDRAFRRKACRIVNLKIQRLGGLRQAKKMHDLCRKNGVPTWVGTMPELGIGALHALYLALLPNNLFPTDVEAGDRWFVEDIIDPPIRVHSGLIEIPEVHRKRPCVDMAVVDRYTKKAATVTF